MLKKCAIAMQQKYTTPAKKPYFVSFEFISSPPYSLRYICSNYNSYYAVAIDKKLNRL